MKQPKFKVGDRVIFTLNKIVEGNVKEIFHNPAQDTYSVRVKSDYATHDGLWSEHQWEPEQPQTTFKVGDRVTYRYPPYRGEKGEVIEIRGSQIFVEAQGWLNNASRLYGVEAWEPDTSDIKELKFGDAGNWEPDTSDIKESTMFKIGDRVKPALYLIVVEKSVRATITAVSYCKSYIHVKFDGLDNSWGGWYGVVAWELDTDDVSNIYDTALQLLS